MTEQNRDATDYIDAAVRACRRRLDALASAYNRGVHTHAEYVRLTALVIEETARAWDVDPDDLYYFA